MSSDELLNKNNKRKSISENDEKSSSTGGSNVDIKADVSGIETAAEEEFKNQESIQKISIIKSTTFIRGCLFILGFSLVFVALGASITAIGSVFHEYSRWIEIISGIMIIIFGLNLLSILKIPGAQRDRGINSHRDPQDM